MSTSCVLQVAVLALLLAINGIGVPVWCKKPHPGAIARVYATAECSKSVVMKVLGSHAETDLAKNGDRVVHL